MGGGRRQRRSAGRHIAGRIHGGEYRKYKATFPLAHPPAPPGAPPAAPALRSQRRPLDGGGWPCGPVLGDGLPARLGLLGGGLLPRGGIKRDERC